MQFLSTSPANSVIFFSWVFDIVVFFDPLAKFKIVLITSFDQFIDIWYFLYSILFESTVQDFVVIHILIIKLSLPVDFAKIEGSWIKLINDLTIHGTCSALLYFGKAKLLNRIEINILSLNRTNKDNRYLHQSLGSSNRG